MAVNQNGRTRKSVRNIYDKHTGLPVMINLYVIKYIYYHIKKAKCFIEEKRDGKKAKYYPIYQNEIPMSRQRFDRINKGENFEITAGEADLITERFGIDMKYFRRDNPVAFDIEGINMTDWKCFYNEKYGNGYALSGRINNKQCSERAEKVERMLKDLTKSDWESRLDRDNPLYAVCYFFHYGKKFDSPNSVKILKTTLKEMNYKDWERENIDTLKEVCGLLEKHCNYINSIITIIKLRSEK